MFKTPLSKERILCATESTNADKLRARIFLSLAQKISWLSSQYLSDGWSGCFLFEAAKVKILARIQALRLVSCEKSIFYASNWPLNLATFCVRTKHYRANGINTFCWCNREIPVHKSILEWKNRFVTCKRDRRSEAALKESESVRWNLLVMKRRSAIILFTFEVIFKHMWMKKLDAS